MSRNVESWHAYCAEIEAERNGLTALLGTEKEHSAAQRQLASEWAERYHVLAVQLAEARATIARLRRAVGDASNYLTLPVATRKELLALLAATAPQETGPA